MEYPDPHGSYKALQASIKAADQTEAANRLVRWLCSGTTSVRKDYQVMFVGEHVVLVKWKGGTTGSGMSRHHVSGSVKIVVPAESGRWRGPLEVGFDARERSRVWDLNTESDKPDSGRLQGQPLRDLMAKVIDLDKHYAERRGVVMAEKRAAAEAEQREREEAQRAAQAARDEQAALLERVHAALAANGGFTDEQINRVLVKRA